MSTPAKAVLQEVAGDDSSRPDNAEAAGGRRGWVGSLQIVAVIALVSLAIIFSQERSPAPAASVSVTAESPAVDMVSAPPVRVVLPEVTSSTLTHTTNGSVQVRNYVALTPQVAGAVVSVADSMRAGGAFQAGEVLFAIDPRDYQLALDQANAEVAAAEKRLLLMEAEGQAARGNYALLHGDAQVPMLVAKVPQIELSKAELDAARARAAKAELELSRTQFSLPFAGRVTESSVGPGQMLAKGQSVGQVFALEALEVAVPIAQEELQRLYPAAGRRALIRAGSLEIPAVVDRVSAELDQRTRFAKLFLSLADDVVLPPGTFVDVTLIGPDVTDSFVLPEAVEQAASTLWLVTDGTLQSFTPNVLARTDAGLIVAAFDAGEGIVVGSVPGARSGMPVTAVGRQTASIETGGISGTGE